MAEKPNFAETLKEQLEVAESELETIQKEINNALAIGLDVTDLQREFNSQKSQIALIKKVYNI